MKLFLRRLSSTMPFIHATKICCLHYYMPDTLVRNSGKCKQDRHNPLPLKGLYLE